jgi:hypothetical protein
MIDVVHRVNGLIRNTERVSQLKRMCEHFGMPHVFPSVPLTPTSCWYSGFVDADGTVSFSMKEGHPQLYVGVSNSDLIDVLPFQARFGGGLYSGKDRYGNNSWKCQVFRKELILAFCDYALHSPLYSAKEW